MMTILDKFDFGFDGTVTEVSPYGNGHINTTYLVKIENETEHL